MNNQICNIPFHQDILIAVIHNGQPHAAMKPICDSIGIDWEGQRQRINRDEVLSEATFITKAPSDGGEQDTLFLPISMLQGWMFGISISRVKPKLRPKLFQFKRECYQVLHDYFTKGEAVNPRKASQKALPDKLTAEQQEAIKQLVLTRGKALPKEHQPKGIITLWSALKTHFGCTYKDIDSAQFAEALSIAARVPLEGEYIGKAELPAPKSGTTLDDYLLYDIKRLVHHFNWLYTIFKQDDLRTHLSALRSPVGSEMSGHFADGYSAVIKLKKLEPEFDAVQRRLQVKYAIM